MVDAKEIKVVDIKPPPGFVIEILDEKLKRIAKGREFNIVVDKDNKNVKKIEMIEDGILPVPKAKINILLQLVPCSFTKATTFQQLIDLVREAEAKLSNAGIISTEDQIHAIRGIYYGTIWAKDFEKEQSTTRNEGFQRFTRPSKAPDTSIPPDVRSILDCGLFESLKDSQDIVDGSRHIDFGHLIIALDARNDPKLTSNIIYPYLGFNIDMGGNGTELVTWVGDLGGGTASLAVKRVDTPSTSASESFKGSDYGGSINLEGDIAGYVVASGSSTQSSTMLTAPIFATGKKLSDALQDYLTPFASSPSWNARATTFLSMNGGTFDASNNLTNRTALITAFSKKFVIFACNYLVSRAKDGKLPFDKAKAAVDHIIPASQEVAEVFVDALDDSHKTGDKIEGKKPFPPPKPAVSGACKQQLAAVLKRLIPW